MWRRWTGIAGCSTTPCAASSGRISTSPPPLVRVDGLDHLVLTVRDVEAAIAHIRSCGVEIIEGPVDRTGARGPLRSIYIRDPDGNLIEIANAVVPGEGGGPC
ncbi:MAG: VOC family protein [Armatimonadetes bacterium]|nr:VOC family protein [Armatimonadota bacterium]